MKRIETGWVLINLIFFLSSPVSSAESLKKHPFGFRYLGDNLPEFRKGSILAGCFEHKRLSTTDITAAMKCERSAEKSSFPYYNKRKSIHPAKSTGRKGKREDYIFHWTSVVHVQKMVDLDYCQILIDKLISPKAPTLDERNCFVKELMLAVKHQEMKELIQGFVDQDLSQEAKKNLKKRFMSFDHDGSNDQKEVDYKELLDKLLDPNLSELEYKPTLQALLEGDLDQDKKNLVSAIINCQNQDQKVNMVKRFKISFDREKDEAERAVKAARAAKAAKKAAREKMEEDLLKFDDDGMTLIKKLVNDEIPLKFKSTIYQRLMEEDIQAEIKNLAIQVLEPENKLKKVQLLEDFKKKRELEKIKAVERKEQEDKQKAERELQKKQDQQKLQKKNRIKDVKKNERLKAVSSHKIDTKEHGLISKQQQKGMERPKEKKDREKDIRKDERSRKMSGPSKACFEEREGPRLEEKIRRNLQYKEREQHIGENEDKKVHDRDTRKEESQNAVARPGDYQDEEKGAREERQRQEKEIKKKLSKRSGTDESLNAVAGPSHVHADEKGGSEAELTWKVWIDPAGLDEFQVVLPDLESSLGPLELDQFKRGFADLEIKSRVGDKKKTKMLKFREKEEESPRKKQKKI